MGVLVAGLGFDPMMARLTVTAVIAGVLFAFAMRLLRRRARSANADKAVAAIEARLGWKLYAWMGAGFAALTFALLLVWRLVEAGAVTWQTGLFLCALMVLAVIVREPILIAYRTALSERLDREERP